MRLDSVARKSAYATIEFLNQVKLTFYYNLSNEIISLFLGFLAKHRKSCVREEICGGVNGYSKENQIINEVARRCQHTCEVSDDAGDRSVSAEKGDGIREDQVNPRLRISCFKSCVLH